MRTRSRSKQFPYADGKRKVLVPGASSPRYLPTGHLIYVSKGTLFAVPFDPDKLETRGNAVAIVNDVQFNSVNGAADLSVSRNGTLVYRKGGAWRLPHREAPKRTMEWIDATGKRSPVTRQDRSLFAPAILPRWQAGCAPDFDCRTAAMNGSTICGWTP